MKQTLSKWTQLHSSGGGKSRLLHLALMLICMLATAQAGWADDVTKEYTSFNGSQSSTTRTITTFSSTGVDVTGNASYVKISSNRIQLSPNGNGTLTFSCKNASKIKALTITWRDSKDKYPTAETEYALTTTPSGNGTHSFSVNSGTNAGSVTTWESGNATTIAVTNNHSSKTFEISGISITYSKSDLETFAFSSTSNENMTVGGTDATPHSWTATYGGSSVSSAISNKVTYVSSNTSVATIVNGKIHAVAAGTTTITAQLSGSDLYNDMVTTNSYQVTVGGGSSTPANLTDSQFAWSAASSTATIGGSNTFPTLTNTVPVDVTYSATTTAGGSTNSEVASIDNLGNITLNKAGTAYINAIFAGSSSYNAKTVTYTLTVNEAASTPAAAPSISFRDSGEDYVTTSNNKDYTITDASHSFKIRVVAAANTYVRYNVGTSDPDAPTQTTGTEIDNTSGSSTKESSNIEFTGTYYIKAIAWDKDKTPASATEVLFTFTPGSSTPTVSFSSPITTVEVGSTVTTNTATLSGASGTITYSSSDDAIASVNSTTGAVTGEAAGTATITATYTENSTNYTDSYEITVTDAVVSGLTAETSKTWSVDDNAWSTYTTSSEIKANTIVDNIEVIADNKHSVKFGSQKKNFTDGSSYTKFWKLGSPGSEYRLLHFKVAGRCKISAYVYQGSNRTVEIRKGGYNGTTIAETDISSSTPTIVSGDYTDNTEADIYVYSKSNELGVFAIKVEPLAAEVSAPTITADDGTTTYTDSKSVTIATTAEGGTTYYKVGTTAETSASAITTAITGTSETIIASPVSDESNIVVSAVTVKDGNYSDIVTATYTYAGLRSFQVKAADKTLQVGGRDNVDPAIYYNDGTLFDISEDEHDLSYYFTFRYERTTGSADDVLVDQNTGIINIPSTATPTNEATITITATPTTAGEAIFKSGAQTGTMKVTVKAKEASTTTMSFYWDPEFTKPVDTEEGDEWGKVEGEGTRSVFKHEYENGRMIYVKAEPGYEVWVATISSNTANDGSLTTPTASIGKYDDTHYSTTHGIPLYIKGMSNGQERTLVIGLKAYKAGTTEGVGSAVSARFRIVQTEAGQAKRPAAPTFSPTKSEAGTLSTAQTVAAVGATNSYVFSKFGSKTLGLGYFINYLEGTQAGREQVATFSTEIADRDIKALQITGSGNEYYISEYGSVNDYMYNLASKLLVTPATYYVNVGDAFTAPVLTKITTDQEEEPDASDYSSPTLTGYFYNKQKAEANAAPYQGLKFEEPAGTSLLSYSIRNFNGAGASIDPSTGVVAIGNKSGYAIVTVNYAGGENYTIKTKKVGEKNTTTSPMTATYRINIVDPDEYLPIINPTSRKFANSLDVTISVPDENHYVKYVIANGEEVKTAEQVKAAGETINKNSRVTVTVGENINVGDKVSVYAIAYGDDGVPSTVVKETYEKVKPLQKPTLSPDGVTKPYEYTESELAVAAVAYNAGAVIYYTTDGSDPTKDGAKTYDGASKILVEKADGTTIVKAAAYLDGIYSDVVTGTYVPTDDLAQPWFLVNGTQVTTSEITISTTDVITIDNGRSTSTYYYTLDGTAPTPSEGEVYSTTGFTLVKTVTATAIATESGLTSPATTVKFIINDEGTSKHSFWEAIDETTPEGTMDANDRKVYVTKHTDTKGTSSYIYVENLAATFGGFDNNDWNKTSIGEKTQGAAMDGVGKYSIRNTMDVKEETDRDYDPTKMLIGTVHGRTHALPSQGAYVKFEPEKDGDLTIWALQQGGLHYSADGDFCSRFIRFRPVFMVDETGKSIAATTAESTACLSKNWSEVEPDNWLPRNSGSQNGDKNLYYDDDQNDAIYGMYTTWMSNNSISDGGSIKPFEAPASIYPTLFTTGPSNASAYNDVHGYVMPSGGNVKYTFPVKAGKTYFFFGFRTKLGIRGFNFVPTTTELGEAVTLPQDATATTIISNNDNQTKNVKLVRNVKKNIWTTFCLPFSVSQTQLENIFGEGTQVMQFVNVKGYTMNVFKHYHHMIVAGTPILVKPTNDDMTEFTFNGVHIQNVTPEEICDEGGDTDYKFVGGYTPMTVNNGSYYIGNKDGLWHKLNNTNGSTLNGSRAYLQLVSGGNARALTLNIASFNGEDDDTTTGIAAIESNGNDLDGVYDNANKFDGNIYNLQGQLVRKHAKNLNGLAKGVYIINGKKVVIND